MKFSIRDGSLLEGVLTYDNFEYGFTFSAQSAALLSSEGVTSVLIGTLQLEVDVETRDAPFTWGYLPNVREVAGTARVRDDLVRRPSCRSQAAKARARVGSRLPDESDAVSGAARLATAPPRPRRPQGVLPTIEPGVLFEAARQQHHTPGTAVRPAAGTADRAARRTAA